MLPAGNTNGRSAVRVLCDSLVIVGMFVGAENFGVGPQVFTNTHNCLPRAGSASEPLAMGRVVLFEPVVTAIRIGQDNRVLGPPSWPGHNPEGIRIGEEVDSKSIAGLPVAGSSPVPSACRSPSQRAAANRLDSSVRLEGGRSHGRVRPPFAFMSCIRPTASWPRIRCP